MKEIWKRILELIIKMLSIKGAVFVIATVLMYQGKIDAWTWGIFAGIMVGIRTFEKAIKAGKFGGEK